MHQNPVAKSHPPEIYASIIESLTDYAVFTVDKDGLVTTWNAGAEKIMLYTPDEIIGRNGDILYTPEDIAARVPVIELVTSLTDGRAVNERFHVKKDRSRFWGSGLVFPLYNKDGRHTGFTKIMKNLSDEDKAEANLREERELAKTLVTTYDEPIIILNSELIVVNATPSFIRFFGLDQQTLIGKNLYDITDTGINMAGFRALLEPILKSNEYHTSFEVDYKDAQKGVRSLLVKPRRIYQPPNVLFSLEFDDLTEGRAKMEEKDVFISVASHEIRTPLSVIKAYAQVLEREITETKPIVLKSVQRINEQVNYMSSLIKSLLDTSKIATGKLTLEQEAFDLCTLVKEQVENFTLTQSTHRIVITNETHGIVFGDKVRTASVIINLLSNAVKYSPNADEVSVSIETEANWVKVSVQDFGLGIPADEQHKLFQRFGRTNTVKRSRIPGTGLGLHLSAEIVKLEGGRIGFLSDEGKGSTFYFMLPLY